MMFFSRANRIFFGAYMCMRPDFFDQICKVSDELGIFLLTAVHYSVNKGLNL